MQKITSDGSKVNMRSKSIKILEESVGINFDLGFYKFIDT